MPEAITNATIVDVRTPGEFAGHHVPGAINIPLDEVAQRINELKELPKPVIAYCRSGNRSAMAVAILKQHGITEAVNGGGINDMLQATK
ncbi:rhodanese-like domain-containing protein [Segetibacter sp.]|uniref:rhodanese-like domain-containing protein n=1 Tax=Segetibacter sp. TaxID=2231182 RepID=UPI00260A65C5|nr:rhodanese-like domain-containing protein [Segetibacter sp.]MCW3078628.1 hypothetical protein [Segetibacter sp.]